MSAASGARRLIDLSHVVEHGLVTYRGLPAPIVCDFLSREASRQLYAPGVEFHIGRIEMVANTGTYVDSPFHRYADGADLAELDLARIADLPGTVVSPLDRASRAIDARSFEAVDVRGRAVLVRTGWDAHWRSERYFEGHPFLTEDAAQLLAARGAAFVGIDSLNIDDTADLRRPVHSILLAQGIPIGEHLTNLGALPREGFRFHAAPVKVARFGTFPVRAYAVVDESRDASKT